MTTLVAWLGVDSRGPASLYLASDSRITWGRSASWDRGRKLFTCRHQPYLFGYCGEAFFPSQVLGQLTERIDADLLRGSDANDLAHQVMSLFHVMIRDRPELASGNSQLVLAQRSGMGMSSTFHVHTVDFPSSGLPGLKQCPLPTASDVIGVWGSGAGTFSHHYARWANGDVRGTSRAMFSAFCDSIAASGDPLSGSPPQLVGLYRVGPGRAFGLIWEGRRYYYATEVRGTVETRAVQWHNALFEVCDPHSLERAAQSQPQPRPSQLHDPSPSKETGEQHP